MRSESEAPEINGGVGRDFMAARLAPAFRTQIEVGTARRGVPARVQRAEPGIVPILRSRGLAPSLFRAFRARGRRSAPSLPPAGRTCARRMKCPRYA